MRMGLLGMPLWFLESRDRRGGDDSQKTQYNDALWTSYTINPVSCR